MRREVLLGSRRRPGLRRLKVRAASTLRAWWGIEPAGAMGLTERGFAHRRGVLGFSCWLRLRKVRTALFREDLSPRDRVPV